MAIRSFVRIPTPARKAPESNPTQVRTIIILEERLISSSFLPECVDG